MQLPLHSCNDLHGQMLGAGGKRQCRRVTDKDIIADQMHADIGFLFRRDGDPECLGDPACNELCCFLFISVIGLCWQIFLLQDCSFLDPVDRDGQMRDQLLPEITGQQKVKFQFCFMDDRRDSLDRLRGAAGSQTAG